MEAPTTEAETSNDLLVELRERADDLERQLVETRQLSDARLILAELKIEAVRSGMVDLDCLKLVDLTSLKLNERGEVEEAASLMARLRKTKPWLFGASSSSSPTAVPPAQQLRQKLATEMTDAEYRVARTAILKQHP